MNVNPPFQNEGSSERPSFAAARPSVSGAADDTLNRDASTASDDEINEKLDPQQSGYDKNRGDRRISAKPPPSADASSTSAPADPAKYSIDTRIDSSLLPKQSKRQKQHKRSRSESASLPDRPQHRTRDEEQTNETKEKQVETTVATRTPNEEPDDKKKRKRKSWKKPKDKPKRPLSAYNLFFQDERAKMLGSTGKSPEPLKKRIHRKSHGKIGFAEMARVIGAKWKTLSNDDKKGYEEQALVEKKRYIVELDAWKAAQKAKIKQQEAVQDELKHDTAELTARRQSQILAAMQQQQEPHFLPRQGGIALATASASGASNPSMHLGSTADVYPDILRFERADRTGTVASADNPSAIAATALAEREQHIAMLLRQQRSQQNAFQPGSPQFNMQSLASSAEAPMTSMDYIRAMQERRYQERLHEQQRRQQHQLMMAGAGGSMAESPPLYPNASAETAAAIMRIQQQQQELQFQEQQLQQLQLQEQQLQLYKQRQRQQQIQLASIAAAAAAPRQPQTLTQYPSSTTREELEYLAMYEAAVRQRQQQQPQQQPQQQEQQLQQRQQEQQQQQQRMGYDPSTNSFYPRI